MGKGESGVNMTTDKLLRAKAMVLAFMVGAPIPPNEFTAKLVVYTCIFRLVK